MAIKYSFAVPYHYKTINEINRAVGSIYACIHHHEDSESVSNMTYDELDNIIYRSEKIALTCRKYLEEKEKSDPNFDVDSYKFGSLLYQKNIPVNIQFTDRTLRVNTPLTFKRFYRDGSLKENYLLMNYVAAAINEWETANKVQLKYTLKLPLIVIMQRKAVRWNRSTICDNDNLEIGRILNTIIIDTLGYSDNAQNVSIHSCFKKVTDPSEEGMSFIVFSRDDIMDHLDEF